MPTRRHVLRTALLALAALLVGGLAAPAHAGNGARFYLSLGTSLSVGTEPNPAGNNRRTQEGYADQLQALLARPGLRLVKLGCPGETSITMISGGICDYEAGSQLAQAMRFLQEHPSSVAFVTLDIGANDIEACGHLTGDAQRLCAMQAVGTIVANLPIILTALRSVAPTVPIIGMNYYNPFLAAWFTDPALAMASVELQVGLNYFLGVVYTTYFGIPVADVAAAFDSLNFALVPGVNIPVNVLTICTLTYMCAGAPVGPNIYANADGYHAIVQAFLPLVP
jgi:lysophospholipase L1-like esterase